MSFIRNHDPNRKKRFLNELGNETSIFGNIGQNKTRLGFPCSLKQFKDIFSKRLSFRRGSVDTSIRGDVAIREATRGEFKVEDDLANIHKLQKRNETPVRAILTEEHHRTVPLELPSTVEASNCNEATLREPYQ